VCRRLPDPVLMPVYRLKAVLGTPLEWGKAGKDIINGVA
jgi:hypothetical protein